MGMTRTADAVVAVRRIADAIIETVNEVGEQGAPGGHIYAVVMQYMSLEQFQQLMRLLVEAGRITRRGECYYPVAGKT